MGETIYFDYGATTKVRPEVFAAMRPFLESGYGNPSSIYLAAREAKKALEGFRENVARAIGAHADEIFFTSGGTEADNWALIGAAQANAQKGKHIITTKIEHHAILHTCEYLESLGFEVSYLPVNNDGLLEIPVLEAAIRPDTILVSVMLANNEIGTLQPVDEIGALVRKNNILFHTDAVQAVGRVPIDVNALQIDMLSMSAHKCYGPKGIGALYIRKGTSVKPFLHGGGQERSKRAGTENMPGIAGFSTAITLVTDEMENEAKRLRRLQDKLINGIFQHVPHVHLNGHREKRLPNNVNVSFEFIEGESLLLMLDMKGIFASSGSACTSGALDPSHVLTAIGLTHELAHGSLRLTMGRETTEAHIDRFLVELPPIVQRLREMSPLYEEYLKKQR